MISFPISALGCGMTAYFTNKACLNSLNPPYDLMMCFGMYMGGKLLGYVSDRFMSNLGGVKREFSILVIENLPLAISILSIGWSNPFEKEIFRPFVNWTICALLISHSFWNIKNFFVDMFYGIIPEFMNNILGPCDTNFYMKKNPGCDSTILRMNILDRVILGEKIVPVKNRYNFSCSVFDSSTIHHIYHLFFDSLSRLNRVFR